VAAKKVFKGNGQEKEKGEERKTDCCARKRKVTWGGDEGGRSRIRQGALDHAGGATVLQGKRQRGGKEKDVRHDQWKNRENKKFPVRGLPEKRKSRSKRVTKGLRHVEEEGLRKGGGRMGKGTEREGHKSKK